MRFFEEVWSDPKRVASRQLAIDYRDLAASVSMLFAGDPVDRASGHQATPLKS